MATRNYLSASNPPAAAANAKPVISPIQASPVASITYDQPRVSTTSGATGIATPYAGSNPTPITAPSYLSGGAPPRYSAPAPAPVYQQPAYFPPPPPIEPPRPQFAPGGRMEFENLFSPEQRAMTEQSFLGGDSDYNAQVGMYQKALDDFVARITGRIQGFETDATDALNMNVKNEGMSTDALGADFGARGLSYSGLFDQSRQRTKDRFAQGRTNITKNKDSNIQNARNEEADYRAENEISRQNAQRAALLRLAQQQQLLDQNW